MALPVTGDWAICQNPEAGANAVCSQRCLSGWRNETLGEVRNTLDNTKQTHHLKTFDKRKKAIESYLRGCLSASSESLRSWSTWSTTNVYAPLGLPHHRWQGAFGRRRWLGWPSRRKTFEHFWALGDCWEMIEKSYANSHYFEFCIASHQVLIFHPLRNSILNMVFFYIIAVYSQHQHIDINASWHFRRCCYLDPSVPWPWSSWGAASTMIPFSSD